jgi:hypothetical protein
VPGIIEAQQSAALRRGVGVDETRFRAAHVRRETPKPHQTRPVATGAPRLAQPSRYSPARSPVRARYLYIIRKVFAIHVIVFSQVKGVAWLRLSLSRESSGVRQLDQMTIDHN